MSGDSINRLPLSEAQALELQATVAAQKRYASIRFKILKVSDDAVTIRTEQGRSFHQNYFDEKRLIEITKEVYTPYVGSRVIHVHPVVYVKSPPEEVTTEWIKKNMHKKGVGLKQMSQDLGVDKATLSGVINQHRTLSRFGKAAFYYYLAK